MVTVGATEEVARAAVTAAETAVVAVAHCSEGRVGRRAAKDGSVALAVTVAVVMAEAEPEVVTVVGG